MGVGVVLARVVVMILPVGLLRRQRLQPFFEIRVQAALVVVYENAGRDVHRVDKAKTFADAAFSEAFFQFTGDVDEAPPGGDFKPEFLAIGFHARKPAALLFGASLARARRLLRCDSKFGEDAAEIIAAIVFDRDRPLFFAVMDDDSSCQPMR